MGEVVLFPGVESADGLRSEARVVAAARQVADIFPDGLAGYFVLGVDATGSYASGWHVESDGTFMTPMLFASFAMEAVRREIVTQSEVVYALNESGDDGA
jgi:hypothetical protein